MTKWQWQALAQIARAYVNGGHPIIGALLVIALAVISFAPIALWLLRWPAPVIAPSWNRYGARPRDPHCGAPLQRSGDRVSMPGGDASTFLPAFHFDEA
jgi:hypothetical protein